MRYKATFVAGFAAGFIAGARAGRERYDQIVKYARQVAEHPTVQKATGTVTTKAAELGKTAAAKAPDVARTAAATVSQQVPKMAATAKQKASDHLPSKLGGKDATAGTPDAATADGEVGYPADGQSSVNGVRYTD